MATMEQFLIDNAAHYNSLVAAYKPRPDKKGPASTDTGSGNPDMIVSTRIRPMLEEETTQGFPPGVFPRKGANIVDLHELRKAVRGTPSLNSFNFTVDHVFSSESSTSEIYDSLVEPLVPWAWGGGVGTLFAYGQTGSGKTYTVSGLERHVAETLMSGSLEGERKINVCVIELAGQTAFDLLNSRKQISILEDSFGTSQMAGALEHVVTSLDTFLELIDAAASLRRTAATQKNDTSSRSHAICRIRIENPSVPSAEDGMLYLVDLAGSEAARDRSAHDTVRMKEAREINTSLSVLKDCIRGRAMVDADIQATGKSTKKAAYVPFRQSTLTKTLKHVFDPASARSCKTVVVACVNPCLADVGASKNTLRYAEMLRVVVPKAKALEYNPDVPATWNNEQLRAWIDTNSGTPPISSSLLAPTESGPQLIRLPIPTFLSRCLQTPDVSPEQAQAFQTKFWKTHVDAQQSQRPAPIKDSDLGLDPEVVRQAKLNCSADPEDANAAVPFMQRIRPGMVVQYKPAQYFLGNNWQGKNYAMILCPASAVGETVCDLMGKRVEVNDEKGSDRGGRYLAAIITPSLLPGSYLVNVWKQIVVNADEIEAEVLMEYDEATRYYYMTL
ncbi:P-loop containing nucleoside triphosphate hydrolase protein [Cercophora newfieldiana]|uniref:Kinesin-like protein n=1 Tax=Cercophora newfieldiana TaxID=92897 RepID=A0AA39YAS1_9PEZI|nr:P-loop containing nucleoside triphosphate hydrolase protein [Cercophora newfieldiana]